MPRTDFEHLASSQFIVCDDARIEMGGKFFLVGVYPGNAIVLPQFPSDMLFRVWSVVAPLREGRTQGSFRLVHAPNVVFETLVDLNIQKVGVPTPLVVICNFRVQEPVILSAQIRRDATSDWFTLGSVHITTQALINAEAQKRYSAHSGASSPTS